MQSDASSPVTKDCTIKCLEESTSCLEPVRFTCKYWESSAEQASGKIHSNDKIPVWLNGESLYDHRSSTFVYFTLINFKYGIVLEAGILAVLRHSKYLVQHTINFIQVVYKCLVLLENSDEINIFGE